MNYKPTLEHLSEYKPAPRSNGFWIDDDFLWDVLPRLTPLAVYVYLALGRCWKMEQYPSIDDLAIELMRSKVLILEAVNKLAKEKLLNKHDLRYLNK